ncbi:unnamed protein product [Rotaria sp. Silwood1]|nr:unnamed protein product [Rotaria sp. Silwood1]
MSLFAFRPLLNILPCRLFSQVCILPYEIDRFNGARVRIEDWPNDTKIIRDTLSTSLEQWQKDKRTSAWLWIPIEKAHVIPIAAELGFIYHNAEERIAVLNKWLLPTKSMIPRFATHQVGVGGAVLHNTTNELLIVKERIKNRVIWKLPGGGHGRSDIYFICRLSALTDTINFDTNEILDCKWTKLDDAIKDENPILRRTAKQLLYGLQNGFEQSIDFKVEQVSSIVTGLTFDFFTRSININN